MLFIWYILGVSLGFTTKQKHCPSALIVRHLQPPLVRPTCSQSAWQPGSATTHSLMGKLKRGCQKNLTTHMGGLTPGAS